MKNFKATSLCKLVLFCLILVVGFHSSAGTAGDNPYLIRKAARAASLEILTRIMSQMSLDDKIRVEIDIEMLGYAMNYGFPQKYVSATDTIFLKLPPQHQAEVISVMTSSWEELRAINPLLKDAILRRMNPVDASWKIVCGFNGDESCTVTGWRVDVITQYKRDLIQRLEKYMTDADFERLGNI